MYGVGVMPLSYQESTAAASAAGRTGGVTQTARAAAAVRHKRQQGKVSSNKNECRVNDLSKDRHLDVVERLVCS